MAFLKNSILMDDYFNYFLFQWCGGNRVDEGICPAPASVLGVWPWMNFSFSGPQESQNWPFYVPSSFKILRESAVDHVLAEDTHLE